MTLELARLRTAGEEAALITPRPDLGTIVVTGRDRASWLNGLVTQEIAKKKTGEGVYSLLVGKTGKILTDAWIVLGKERIALGIHRPKLAEIQEHLDQHLVMEDAELEDKSDSISWIFTHGPFTDELAGVARANSAEAASLDWTGRRDAGVILATPSDAGSLADTLLGRAGKNGLVAGVEEFEPLRIAWGVPRFGKDFDETTSPHEGGLDKLAVAFDKGCYLGQEAVFMLEARGHAKKLLMRIEVDGAEPVPVGSEITLDDGLSVGTVTSAGPRDLASSHALGFVKYKPATDREALSIRGRSARIVDRAGALKT